MLYFLYTHFISVLVFHGFMVKRCINGYCHYFCYGVNVEWQSSVKFVVPSTHPCVTAYFLSNETVTPLRGSVWPKIWISRSGVNLNLNLPWAFSRLLSNPLIKLAKSGPIWPVSSTRTMPIVTKCQHFSYYGNIFDTFVRGGCEIQVKLGSQELPFSFLPPALYLLHRYF